MITVPLIVMVLALVCLLLATVNYPSRLNLQALGLFFWLLALCLGVVLGNTPLHISR